MPPNQQFLFAPEKPLVKRLGNKFFRKIPKHAGDYKMRDAQNSIVYVGDRDGFTLVELLVVIAIIGILAALLLPAISQSKIRAQSVACLNNVKELQLCFHLYTSDNNDSLPPNNFVYDNSIGQPFPGNQLPGAPTSLPLTRIRPAYRTACSFNTTIRLRFTIAPPTAQRS